MKYTTLQETIRTMQEYGIYIRLHDYEQNSMVISGNPDVEPPTWLQDELQRYSRELISYLTIEKLTRDEPIEGNSGYDDVNGY